MTIHPEPLAISPLHDSPTIKASTDSTETTPPLPMTFADLLQTVIRLSELQLSEPLAPLPVYSPDLYAGVQRLIDLITHLRQTAPASGLSSSTSRQEGILSPACLLPYVSEEAEEVLDLLKTLEPQAVVATSQPELLALNAFIPHLLWSIARTSYSVMQLIEGIRVKVLLPEHHWVAGMLRLVILLEGKTATGQWCFDLVTGCPPTSLLDLATVIHTEETILPLRQATPALIGTNSGAIGPASGQQLQELSQQIQDMTPAVTTLLAGVPVEFLQPGMGWESGGMQLQLGWEFVPHGQNLPEQLDSFLGSDLVEAELLEETDAGIEAGGSLSGSEVASPMPVSLVECPRQLLDATTLIRLAANPGALLGLDTRPAALVGATGRIWQLVATRDGALLPIVEEAYRASERLTHSVFPGCLVQPELLMDELLPKLLWHLTRSSYVVTQFISGFDLRVLQPGKPWQQGTLRLVGMLQIKAVGVNCILDLATGQSIPRQVLLSPDTILDTTATHTLPHLFQVKPRSFLFQAKTLMAELDQQIQMAAPELKQLVQGIAIEWLESEQDWQPGSLNLHLGLAFTEVFY